MRGGLEEEAAAAAEGLHHALGCCLLRPALCALAHTSERWAVATSAWELSSLRATSLCCLARCDPGL